MALGGISATWDSTKPANTDQIGSGDDQIRSDKTNLQGALNSEHNFPEGGGSAIGYHRLGSGRAFYGTKSQVSSTDTDGRLMVTSNGSSLYHVGSSVTLRLGSSNALIVATGGSLNPGNLPATHYWALETQPVINTVLSAGSVTATFDSAFSGRPLVWAHPNQAAGTALHPIAVPNSASFCTVYFYDLTGALVPGGSEQCNLFSLGSRLIG